CGQGIQCELSRGRTRRGEDLVGRLLLCLNGDAGDGTIRVTHRTADRAGAVLRRSWHGPEQPDGDDVHGESRPGLHAHPPAPRVFFATGTRWKHRTAREPHAL